MAPMPADFWKFCFNTQPPEGGCLSMAARTLPLWLVSTHSRPKAAASDSVMYATCCCWVSTHSRPKAAASVLLNATVSFSAFQHTAARRRLRELSQDFQAQENVSTHSRPKAAAQINNNAIYQEIVSTHSRPKAAAHFFCNIGRIDIVSTHSRP